MTRLMMPICGLARKIQATVNRIDGMTSGMSESAKKSVLNGVFVRSFIHASVVPSTNAKTAVPQRELNRGPEQPQRVGAAVGRGVVAEREDRVDRRRLRRAEALPQQKAERNDGDVDREGDASANHDPLPVERRGADGTLRSAGSQATRPTCGRGRGDDGVLRRRVSGRDRDGARDDDRRGDGGRGDGGDAGSADLR